MNKLLQINCPHCDKVFYYYQSEFRPFCCERCKMIDLGHWFEESYRVPTKENIQTDLHIEKSQNENDNENEIQNEDSGLYEDDENNY